MLKAWQQRRQAACVQWNFWVQPLGAGEISLALPVEDRKGVSSNRVRRTAKGSASFWSFLGCPCRHQISVLGRSPQGIANEELNTRAVPKTCRHLSIEVWLSAQPPREHLKKEKAPAIGPSPETDRCGTSALGLRERVRVELRGQYGGLGRLRMKETVK